MNFLRGAPRHSEEFNHSERVQSRVAIPPHCKKSVELVIMPP